MVEEQLAEASIALAWRDPDRARKVIANDEALDSEEVEIEEHCIELLARHQPVASDLRLIAACLKINNDLERIGDLAASIAERISDLQLPPPEEIRTTLEELGRRSRRMLRRAIDSFAVRDAAGAKRVLTSDDAVDALNRQVILSLLERMKRDPEDIPRIFALVTIARRLERIADHATNIAEDVVYMVEGRIVRHHHEPLEAAATDSKLGESSISLPFPENA